MPLWLSPVQAIVLNIADAHSGYANEVTESLKRNNIRCKSDLRNEKLGLKIREAAMSKVPYVLTIGKSEEDGKTVSVRKYGGEQLGKLKISEFEEIMKSEQMEDLS